MNVEEVNHENVGQRSKKRTQNHSIKFTTFFEGESEVQPKRIKHRRKRGETNGYPTKNFLPNFKGPHL